MSPAVIYIWEISVNINGLDQIHRVHIDNDSFFSTRSYEAVLRVPHEGYYIVFREDKRFIWVHCLIEILQFWIKT